MYLLRKEALDILQYILPVAALNKTNLSSSTVN